MDSFIVGAGDNAFVALKYDIEVGRKDSALTTVAQIERTTNQLKDLVRTLQDDLIELIEEYELPESVERECVE